MMCQHLVFSQTRAHLCLEMGQSVHILVSQKLYHGLAQKHAQKN